MHKSQAGKSPDQVGGHSSRGIGRQIEVSDQQKEGDVLEVILMGSTHTFNIRVGISDSSAGFRILHVCKYLSTMDLNSVDVTNI